MRSRVRSAKAAQRPLGNGRCQAVERSPNGRDTSVELLGWGSRSALERAKWHLRQSVKRWNEAEMKLVTGDG